MCSVGGPGNLDPVIYKLIFVSVALYVRLIFYNSLELAWDVVSESCCYGERANLLGIGYWHRRNSFASVSGFI